MLRKILPLAALGLTLAMATGYGPHVLRLQTPGADAEWSEFEYGKEWAAYLAPEEACPGGEKVEAPVAEQQVTVLCLLNWARTQRGLPALQTSPVLMRSTELKAADLARCDEFLHTPCGIAYDAGARSLGYSSPVGENIAWGTGPARAPRPTVDGWLHSPGHRSNLFRREWREQGIALLAVGRYQGEHDAAVWVSQFGG